MWFVQGGSATAWGAGGDVPAPGDYDGDGDWPAEVGFVSHWLPTWPMLLGQVCFLDRFTATMSRHAQRLAVEDRSAFDDRFGVPPIG